MMPHRDGENQPMKNMGRPQRRRRRRRMLIVCLVFGTFFGEGWVADLW